MRQRCVDVITMGCSKNLVDSEHLLRQLTAAGFRVWHDPETTHGDIAVVNTCGFIGDAKEESVNMILSLCDLKARGELRRVYVMGCLAERYRADLEREIPEVDGFFGKFDWGGILEALDAQFRGDLRNERQLTTPPHYAYVKISEGCDRKCAYCAIPIITGRHTSRPVEDILEEVRLLARQGVREFQVIAQELTYYGVDLYGRQMLPELVDRMAGIEGVEWIRLHYAYPAHFPLELLPVMARHANVCRYLDIALQHISDHMLQRMRRHTTRDETLHLLRQIRKAVPGICLRTTLMVGFPGETEADFEELLDFVREARFERMGAFVYSEEEGTYAAEHYEDDIPEDVKQERLDRLMALQEEISAELNAQKVGQRLKIVVDRREGDFFIGRTEFDSPEVDGEVLLRADTNDATIGRFYQAEIIGADDYDLYGQIITDTTNCPSL